MVFEEQSTAHRALIALQEAVRQLPSTMARLVFLSGLRDPSSGVYGHPTAMEKAERARIDRLLRGMHDKTFAEWLNYRLEEQKADLDLYFSSLECGKPTAVQNWLWLESYRSLVPASASIVERQLFFSDLEVLLHVMASEIPSFSSDAERRVPNGPLLTTEELSKWLGVSPRTLRFWAECAEIPAVKVGRQWRFARERIREWLRSRTGGR